MAQLLFSKHFGGVKALGSKTLPKGGGVLFSMVSIVNTSGEIVQLRNVLMDDRVARDIEPGKRLDLLICDVSSPKFASLKIVCGARIGRSSRVHDGNELFEPNRKDAPQSMLIWLGLTLPAGVITSPLMGAGAVVPLVLAFLRWKMLKAYPTHDVVSKEFLVFRRMAQAQPDLDEDVLRSQF